MIVVPEKAEDPRLFRAQRGLAKLASEAGGVRSPTYLCPVFRPFMPLKRRSVSEVKSRLLLNVRVLGEVKGSIYLVGSASDVDWNGPANGRSVVCTRLLFTSGIVF